MGGRGRTKRTRTGGRAVAALPLVACGALVAAGCGGDRAAAGAAEPVVRDSAGVRIVESAAPVWPEDGGWAIDPEPTLAVGVLEGEQAEMFAGVVDPALRSDGSLVLADRESSEVRAFAPDGRLLWRSGGLGEGPGEFQRISWLDVLPGDSAMIWDIETRRMTVLAPDGSLARSYPTTPPEGAPMASPIALLPDDRLLVSGGVSFTGGEGAAEEVVWPSAGYYTVDRAGTVLDSVTAVRSTEFRVTRSDRGIMVRPSSFGRRGFAGAVDDQLLVVRSDRPEIRRVGLDGALEGIVRLGVPPRTPTGEDRAAYVERAVERAGEDADLAEVRRLAEETEFPERYPVFDGLQIDPSGRVWLERWQAPWEADEPERWWVVDADGAWLGEVTMPPGFELEGVEEGAVVGVARDDFDVERVRVHRIVR